MNYYLENRMINEIKGQQNVAYLFANNELFSLTGYRVLQNPSTKGFVKCAKLTYNGKVKIIYFTSQYQSLQTAMGFLDADGFMTVLSNLLSIILEIRSIGFLRCQNIDFSPARIFIDPNTYAVYLIHLPVNDTEHLVPDVAVESDLRSSMVKILGSHPRMNCRKTNELSSVLANGSMDLRQVVAFLKRQGGVEPEPVFTDAGESGGRVVMKLTAVGAPTPTVFTVDQDRYYIGTRKELADGVVTFNNRVSKRHCEISQSKNGAYFVKDVGSSNGTKLNGKKLTPQQSYPLRSGDSLRLADLEFAVRVDKI